MSSVNEPSPEDQRTADSRHPFPARLALPSRPWRYTDDTAMAIAITEILEEYEEIDPERLAEEFGRRFLEDLHRGYGPAMHSLLPELADHPKHWKELSNCRRSCLKGEAPSATVPQCALLP